MLSGYFVYCYLQVILLEFLVGDATRDLIKLSVILDNSKAKGIKVMLNR